jgi:aminoglycoside 6'-N-acetyltransferase I
MEIDDLGRQSAIVIERAAELLVEEFDEPRGWPTVESAREEVRSVLREGFARVALEGEILLGWVGGLPEYAGRVWELHPMVVRREYRRRGIGRALATAFEAEAGRRGALTATLGTDDDSGMTSAADIDLYEDIPRHIAELRDLGRAHPFLFYRRLGYVVTGFVPDANGRGRPDIYMSKRLQSAR